MMIAFQNKRLERLFNSETALQKKHGKRQARTIMMRLAVLKNARTLADVPTSRPERRHLLKGKRKMQYAVDLVHPFRLIFTPNHNPIPRLDDEGIDLERVTAIKIVEVIDYH